MYPSLVSLHSGLTSPVWITIKFSYESVSLIETEIKNMNLQNEGAPFLLSLSCPHHGFNGPSNPDETMKT